MDGGAGLRDIGGDDKEQSRQQVHKPEAEAQGEKHIEGLREILDT